MVADLRQSTAKVTLLLGDSGIGKSEVLRAAQGVSSQRLAPDPIKLRNGPGALQRGLLESLAAAVAVLLKDEPAARRVGKILVETARRIVQENLDDLPRAVVRHLIGIVRKHVSDEVADVLNDFNRQLQESMSQQLIERIEDAMDPDAVDVTIEFAREVVSIADGVPLIMALDDADRLERESESVSGFGLIFLSHPFIGYIADKQTNKNALTACDAGSLRRF